MPSPFDALDDALQGAVLASFGETTAVNLHPRTKSQYSEPILDGSRPEKLIRGIFTAAAADQMLKGNAFGDFAGTTHFASMPSEFWVPYSEVVALGYRIVAGDLISLTTRTGESKFCIVRIQPTDRGDLNLILAVEDPTTAPQAPLS